MFLTYKNMHQNQLISGEGGENGGLESILGGLLGKYQVVLCMSSKMYFLVWAGILMTK